MQKLEIYWTWNETIYITLRHQNLALEIQASHLKLANPKNGIADR
jgi:hypothetical protein